MAPCVLQKGSTALPCVRRSAQRRPLRDVRAKRRCNRGGWGTRWSTRYVFIYAQSFTPLLSSPSVYLSEGKVQVHSKCFVSYTAACGERCVRCGNALWSDSGEGEGRGEERRRSGADKDGDGERFRRSSVTTEECVRGRARGRRRRFRRESKDTNL